MRTSGRDLRPGFSLRCHPLAPEQVGPCVASGQGRLIGLPCQGPCSPRPLLCCTPGPAPAHAHWASTAVPQAAPGQGSSIRPMSGNAGDGQCGDPSTPIHVPEWARIVVRNLRGLPVRDLMQAEESLRWLLRWARDLQSSPRSPPALEPAPIRPRSRSPRRGRRSHSRRSWTHVSDSRSPPSLTPRREADGTGMVTDTRVVNDPTPRPSAPIDSSGVAAVPPREVLCSQDADSRRPKNARANRSPSPRGTASRVVTGPYRLPTLPAGRPHTTCLSDDEMPARGSPRHVPQALGPGQPGEGVRTGPPPLSSPNNLPVDRGQVLRTGGGYELVLRRARRAPSVRSGAAKAADPSASSRPPRASPAATLSPRPGLVASAKGGAVDQRETSTRPPRTPGRGMRSRSSP